MDTTIKRFYSQPRRRRRRSLRRSLATDFILHSSSLKSKKSTGDFQQLLFATPSG